MRTVTIYKIGIEDSKYSSGSSMWPVGTAAKLKTRLEERFPGLQIDIVDEVVGGVEVKNCSDIERDTIQAVTSEILSEL